MSRGEPVVGPLARRARPDADRVHVAALVHKYPPGHNAGAEYMAHALFRDLVARGHRVTVMVNKTAGPYTLDGVDVVRYRATAQFEDADVVVTHLDMTAYAMLAARHVGVPTVHLLHNDRQLRYHGVRPYDADLCIANSHWLAESYDWWPGRIEVVHPPVDVDTYAVGVHVDDRVTLMNLSAAKGGPLFWRLAEMMPERRFLAVRGAYARQEIAGRVPPNVELIGNTPDVVRDVYARTRVLLIPSSYESWGRVGIEAACSGIPSVCHPTPGLVESLGTCAVWCDRDEPEEWFDAIELLFDDLEEYERRAACAYTRARELDPKLGDYDRWEALILDVVRGRIRAS